MLLEQTEEGRAELLRDADEVLVMQQLDGMLGKSFTPSSSLDLYRLYPVQAFLYPWSEGARTKVFSRRVLLFILGLRGS